MGDLEGTTRTPDIGTSVKYEYKKGFRRKGRPERVRVPRFTVSVPGREE